MYIVFNFSDKFIGGVTYGNLRFYLARDVTKDRTVTKLAIANIEVIRYAQVTQV